MQYSDRVIEMRIESEKKIKKGSRLSKIVLLLVFLTGLGILLYPVISNEINKKSQTYVISHYEDASAKLDKDAKDMMLKVAKEYNEYLRMGGAMVKDPFSDDNTSEGISYLDLLSIGESMGHLEIPKIGIDIPIYHGTSDETLQKGIGHIEQTSLPIGGNSTHSVLTGHRGLPTAMMFRNLGKVEIGDIFYIHTLSGTIAYKVNEINVVVPNDIEKLKIIDGKDLVTLITCEPYMINSHRLLVTGERIEYVATIPEQNVPPEDKEIDETTDVPVATQPVEGKNQSNWIYAAFPAALSMAVLITLIRKRKNMAGDAS